MNTHPKPFPETTPPVDAEAALASLRALFARCDDSARRYFERSEADGIDFDIRCAYAGIANKMVRAAAIVAAAIAHPPGAETVHRIIVERV